MRRTGAAVIATALFGMGTAAQAAPLRTVEVPGPPVALRVVPDPTAAGAFLGSLPVEYDDERGVPASAERPLRSADGGRTWASFGTWPAGARVAALATHASAPGTIWVAEPDGDVLRSTDDGATWSDAGVVPWLIDGAEAELLGAGRDAALALGDAQVEWEPGTICGTGTSGAAQLRVLDVLATRDGGATWRRRLGSSRTRILEAVAVDPVDGSRILAVVGRRARGRMDLCADHPVRPDRFRLLESTDDGRTWRAVGPERAGIATGLSIDPADPRRLAVAGLHGAVHLSVDGGASWRVAHRGSPGLAARFTARGALLISDPVTAPVLLRRGATVADSIAGLPRAFLEGLAASGDAVVVASERFAGLRRSADGGASFVDDVVPATTGPALPRSGVTLASGTVGFVSDGILRLGDAGILPVAGLPRTGVISLAAAGGLAAAMTYDGVHLSRDGGATWAPSGPRGGRAPIFGPLAVGRDGRTVLAATPSGLLRSRDAGATWRRLPRFGLITPFFGLDLAVQGRRALVVGVDGSLLALPLAGGAWRRLLAGDGDCALELEPSPLPGRLLATRCGRLLRIVGRTATPARAPAGARVVALARAPGDGRRVIAAAARSLLLSVDDGRSWRRIARIDGRATAVAWRTPTVVAVGISTATGLRIEDHAVPAA